MIKYKIQPVKNYLLLIDKEGIIKINDYAYQFNSEKTSEEIIEIETLSQEKIANITDGSFTKYKILGYRSLTKEHKKFNLPLLPEWREDLNDHIYDLAYDATGTEYGTTDQFDQGLIKGFVIGYKATQHRQFTIEDMRKSFIAGRKFKQGGKYSPDQPERNEPDFEPFIKLLTTQQLPKEFIPEMVNEYQRTDNCIHCSSLLLSDDQLFCHNCGKEAHKIYSVMKTMINSQGNILVGKYKY